jgi:hypothetical protein
MLPSLHSTDFTRFKVQVAGWAYVHPPSSPFKHILTTATAKSR